jgi:hypothetical protein
MRICIYCWLRYLSPLSAALLITLFGLDSTICVFHWVRFDYLVVCTFLSIRTPNVWITIHRFLSHWEWSAQISPPSDLCSGSTKFMCMQSLLWFVYNIDMCSSCILTFHLFILSYLPHDVHMMMSIFDRLAVLFTISTVWLYAYLRNVADDLLRA